MKLNEIKCFEDYLEYKKISSVKMKESISEEWEQMKAEYDILGIHGFDQRKKYLINEIRIKYPIT